MSRFSWILPFLFVLVIFSHPAFSQQKTVVKGYVLNAETNEPVINAAIVVSDTKKGTSTGNKGYFELHLNEGAYNIQVTSVGYSDIGVAVKVPSIHGEPIRILLQPIRIEIEGVDVFANLRIAEKDTSINKVPLAIIPAVTRISAIEIEKQGATTLTDALKFVPGGWTENRGRKTKQFFSVRGQKYPYPDYSIDGIWQKEFEETGYFLSALDIESVEIVRSSSALVKGLSGLTGVVEVKTKKP
ncbi:MAG TPA: TonB-dependent receptor, partial [Prolixibacteraceae bacterium]|nr:TonB-dependent receptor [Prolixibacteraceae bacterium]